LYPKPLEIEGETHYSGTMTLSGNGNVQEWNALTGEIVSWDMIDARDGTVHVHLSLEPWETKFIVIGP